MKVTSIVLAASLVMSAAYAADTTSTKTTTPTSKKAITKKLKKKRAQKPAAKATIRKTEALRSVGAPGASATSAAPNSPDRIKTSSAAETVVSAAPANNITATTSKSGLYQTLKDNVELTYFGIYRGASVADPGNKYQPNLNGSTAGAADVNSAQSMENYITTGWKPAKDWMVGVSNHFYYNGSETQNNNGNALGSGMELLDPALVVTKANLVDKGQLKVKGYFFAELPVTQQDFLLTQNRHMLTSLTPTANITYDIKGTRFSVGTYTYFKYYVSGPNSPDDLRTYRFVAAPYGSYQISPTVAATLWVDLIDVRRHGGSPFFSPLGMSSMESDIEPGISWDIIPGALTVNPIINIYPANPTLASTSFQAVVIGKAF